MLEANDQTFKKLIEENEKVLVKFHAAWCGSCRLIAPKFKSLAENGAYTDVTFLEIDAENNPEARSLAKVNNLPFFASFKNAQLVEAFPSSKIEAVEDMINSL